MVRAFYRLSSRTSGRRPQAERGGAEVSRGPRRARASGLVVQTEYGQRGFSRGDRIYPGLNDKREIGVTNGSLGTEEAVCGSEPLVKLDGGRLVVVDTGRYKHVDHRYAVTVHTSQGVTVDRVFAVADDHWRSASADLVTCCRICDHPRPLAHLEPVHAP